MRYRDFEFFATPTGWEQRPMSGTSKNINKEFFCEIYHAEDEGMTNLLDCFSLKEGQDIPVNDEPCLIVNLQKHIDDHYEELMADHKGQETPEKKNYLQEFLHNTDFNLLYQQKQALLTARERHLPIDKETLDGLVHFLDFIGDWAEQEGVFQYPSLEEKPSIIDELISLAEEELNESGKISYVAPDNEYVINITVERVMEDNTDPDKECYYLELLQPSTASGKGFYQRFSGSTDYNDFTTLRELAKAAIQYWDRRKASLKPDLNAQIASASERSSPPSSPYKALEPEIR